MSGGGSSAAPAKPREKSIDLLKGFLVLGMVYCHTLQFFSDGLVFPVGQRWIEFINLITFSGFVLCFGYASQLAYYSKPLRKAAGRMLLAALKTWLAFGISGTAYRIFIDGNPPAWKTVWPILLMLDMPGWSEFLASFTYLTLAGLLLFVPIRKLTERKTAGFAAAGLLLLTTAIPYGAIHAAPLAPLIGTRDMASFPVVQYSPLYLAGILFARYRIGWDWRAAAVSAAASGLFVWRWISSDVLPERFPPSVWWIIGPSLLLYGLYLLVKWLERYPQLIVPFEAMGRNVLWFLIISNVFIFALKSARPDLLLSTGNSFVLAVVLLALAGFGSWIITKPAKPKTAAAAA